MIKVIFICLGNICRSPMAEAVFQRMVKERGMESRFSVISRATSGCEAGNPVYPPARRELERHGLNIEHRATVLTRAELADCDYALVMDGSNLTDVRALAGRESSGKVRLLCSFTSRPRDVADPWYTRDFAKAFADIEDGCRGFLDYILREQD